MTTKSRGRIYAARACAADGRLREGCGRHICRPYPVALFLPRACNKVPGRDKSLPYTHLINENARRISTAGIVHAINY